MIRTVGGGLVSGKICHSEVGWLVLSEAPVTIEMISRSDRLAIFDDNPKTHDVSGMFTRLQCDEDNVFTKVCVKIQRLSFSKLFIA